MAEPVGYDRFLEATPGPAFPTGDVLAATLSTLRAQRRAVLEHCDEAKDCKVAEPDVEIANQMEPIVQSLAGSLAQFDKAIRALECIHGNAIQYQGLTQRVVGVIAHVRAGR